MKPEMKSPQNEILTNHKKNSVYITFHCGRNDMKFRFGGGPRKTVHSLKANHFCFDETNTCRCFLSFGYCLHDLLSPEMKSVKITAMK